MGQYGETVYLNISSFTGLPSRAGALCRDVRARAWPGGGGRARSSPLPLLPPEERECEELINTPRSISAAHVTSLATPSVVDGRFLIICGL